MNSKLKRNWWIDVFIFTGFTTTFFLDLTGIAVHQWIGVFCGILAIYHLFLHRDWMLAASARFFGKTTNQSRLYYALDLTLLFGFSLILITGLVISTWLNPSLGNFSAWLNIHIAISMITLLAVLLKLTLHWRWIVHTTRKLWASPIATPANPIVLQPARVSSRSIDRREFMRMAGITGTAALFALVNASQGLAESVAALEVSVTDTTTQSIQSTRSRTFASNQSYSLTQDDSCTICCVKHCSYPGHCRIYGFEQQWLL